MLRQVPLKGYWASITHSLRLFQKVEIFIPLKVLALWYWLHVDSYPLVWFTFKENVNFCSILYLSRSTSINTQHSSLWDTLWMMLFTKDHIMKTHWQNQLKSLALVKKFSIKFDTKRKCRTCPMPHWIKGNVGLDPAHRTYQILIKL